ncbi:MAG: hypothetical protein AAGA67_09965, partial [Cyanobacteria bacterium P01_F01_bin.153]
HLVLAYESNGEKHNFNHYLDFARHLRDELIFSPEFALTRRLKFNHGLTSLTIYQRDGEKLPKKLLDLREMVKSFQPLGKQAETTRWSPYGTSGVEALQIRAMNQKNIARGMRDRLSAAVVEYCDMSHVYKLTSQQKHSIKKYCFANLLLIECLNSDCYISREIRQEIEETLLLPIAEIERYKAERS